jgi:3-hydroxy-9,10-secoandrosta-1,3,5(10)-triene-9,17-dione monooxygenase reductase component
MTVSAAVFRDTLGRFGSGVVVVAGRDAAGPTGLACQSFFAASLDPPLVAVSPSIGSASWRRVASTGAFAVSVLAAGQRRLCLAFGRGGPRDKFAASGWDPAPSGSPFLHGALAWLDCRISATYPAGDHFLVLGEVTFLRARSGDPLIFYRGAFGTFAGPDPVAVTPPPDEVWGSGPWQEGIDW